MADLTLAAATILEDWAKDVTNVFGTRNDFFRHYRDMDKKAGNGRKGYRVVEGGRLFVETLATAVNGTFRGYNDRETIDTTESEEVKEAQYSQKIIAGSLNISKLQEAQNMPAYQIHDMFETKLQIAEASMEEILGDSALSDGTTDTKIPGGLQLIIGTTAGTVGTISESANPVTWAPHRDTTGVTGWNTSDEGMIALDSAMQNAKRGQEKVDLIVTTVAIKSLINIMVIKNGQNNYSMGAAKGELGFDDIFYRRARVIDDDNVPSGRVYGVNTRHLRFAVLKKGEFKTTKMKEPIDGLYSVAQMYVFCNFTCSDRRLQFVMTGVTG